MVEREGLENSTAIRRIRKLRNCGELEIPGMPQESPRLALDLALGFGGEELLPTWRSDIQPLCVFGWDCICRCCHRLEVSPSLRRYLADYIASACHSLPRAAQFARARRSQETRIRLFGRSIFCRKGRFDIEDLATQKENGRQRVLLG